VGNEDVSDEGGIFVGGVIGAFVISAALSLADCLHGWDIEASCLKACSVAIADSVQVTADASASEWKSRAVGLICVELGGCAKDIREHGKSTGAAFG